jgi:hypothetical protein
MLSEQQAYMHSNEAGTQSGAAAARVLDQSSPAEQLHPVCLQGEQQAYM